MSNWDRLHALALLDAIDCYCASGEVQLDDDHPLLRLRAAAATAAKTANTHAFEVSSLKFKVSGICKSSKLCDGYCVTSPSQNCRLLGGAVARVSCQHD
jgi:hypothetical protein